MLKAIKVRIYPNKEQQGYISQQLGCCRFVYNACLSYRKNEYEHNQHSVTPSETDKYCNHVLKNEFPFLREVNAKVLQQSLRDLQTAYTNFFKQGNGFPKFKKRGHHDFCRFPKDAFSGIHGNRVSLVKALKDILFKCSERDERYLNRHKDCIRSATLERTASGKFFLSILVDYQPMTSQADACIGIDLGVKDFIITSNGEKFENKRFAKQTAKQLARLQKSLSRKVKGSHNYEKTRIKIARLHETVANRRLWYLHNLTSVLTSENQVICIEDLNVKGMVKNHHLASALQDVGFGEFERLLYYKASAKGRTLIKIDRFFPSTKLCSKCGYKYKGITLNVREWVCSKCGERHDRDVNAAQNILQEGLRLLSENK